MLTDAEVAALRRLHNVTPDVPRVRMPLPTADQQEEIHRLHATGLGHRMIASKMDMSPSRVRRVLAPRKGH